MPAAEPKSSIGGFWWLAALPLLYVLSIGPVGLAAERIGTDPIVIWRFYAPIVWLHGNTFLRKPLEAYLGLWGVK